MTASARFSCRLLFALAAFWCAATTHAVEVRYYPVPAGGHPHDVAAPADGTVWYTAQRTGHLGILDPKTGKTELVALGKGSSPHGVIVGPDGAAQMLPAAEHVAIYHFLTEGRCRASLLGGTQVFDLEAGDLIMLPHADGHLLGSDLQLAPVHAAGLVEPAPEGGLMRIRHGGGGARTRFICGFLACDKRLCKPLLDALPRLLRVSLGADPATSWMVGALQYGAAETHTPRPGTEAVMGRLSELLFVEAMRKYIRDLPEHQQGWLAGLRDPFVGRALALMHADPARGWEVEMLAREAGLSRSALADRFVSLIGEPPMQYLAGWRLALAAQSLSKTNDAVARIAERVGYESEAAFNRAFKREFGMPPATWRRAARLSRAHKA